MYIACPACQRQYDVGHLEEGRQVRCLCDEVMTVEKRRAHTPRASRCSSCGGPLEEGVRHCGFCRSEVTLDERNLSGICPKCLARLAKGGRHCMECGLRIQPQRVRPLPADATCPRCEGALQVRILGTGSITECSHCGGLWLEPDAFDAAQRDAEDSGWTEALGRSKWQPPRTHAHKQVSYLPCIVCKDLMVRRNYGGASGVIIDLCGEHGVWLDHREIDQILAFIQDGGLHRARRLDLAIQDSEDQRRRRVSDTSITTSSGTVVGSRPSPGTDLGRAVEWIGSVVGALFT